MYVVLIDYQSTMSNSVSKFNMIFKMCWQFSLLSIHISTPNNIDLVSLFIGGFKKVGFQVNCSMGGKKVYEFLRLNWSVAI